MTLTVDNSEHSLPVEYDEVAITRRYYRSGESEFFINKKSARLKDIHELLMDTGTFTEVDRFVRHRCTASVWGIRTSRPTAWLPVTARSTGARFLYTLRTYRPGRVSGRDARGQDLQNHGHGSGGGLPRGVPVRLRRRRIQEAVDALSGYGQIFYRNACSSGRIPQISVIMGPCAGGAVYSPALTDLIVMVEKESQMFITGPAVVAATTGEEISAEDLGGADTHTTMSGVAHLSARSEEEALGAVRCLLSYLPPRQELGPPNGFTEHEELQPLLDTVIPDDSSCLLTCTMLSASF